MENNKSEISRDVLKTGRIIVDAVKCQLNGSVYEFPEDADFKKIYKLSERHKVTPLVAGAVVSCTSADEDVKKVFRKELFRCAARYSAQEKEAEELTAVFVEQKIRHNFLKGMKVAGFYDNPDMRFMLDMDVYIEPSKVNEVKKILKKRGYVYDNYEDEKDAGYVKKPFLNFELHKELKYDYDKGYEYYKGAFERMVTEENGYTMNMTNEDFYVYILSHAAHHFEKAGTGIKTVVDHFYLKRKLKPLCDGALLKDSLEKTGLSVFSDRMDALSEYWFGNAQGDDSLEEMGEYIILSGVFGNETNDYLSGIMRGDYTEKKSSYFLSRLFLPYKLMKKRYPILIKLPFLLPLMWVVRFFSALSNKDKYTHEAQNINSVDSGLKEKRAEFLKKNGF
ncbi:MAG: nucleotidyltransferase family protein [Clostridia bacterium]|nr:nucleotidyltransferase family protein [Clostridia bacterium]